ncbi:MAG TPA: amino acid adenylation domain-containing protein [Acidimicrobiales bacterium]|nr:amino acid adenylation domain-containing protein [Acidimicrobiales bacterium]
MVEPVASRLSTFSPGAHEPAVPDVLELVLRHAEERPQALALRDPEGALTYAELGARTGAVAANLLALGVLPGDRVALYLGNSATFISVALGCLWLGAPFVPLGLPDPEARVAAVLSDCRPKIVVAKDANSAPGFLTRAAPEVVSARELVHPHLPSPHPSSDDERDAYLIYTSGTTGVPKGVRTPVRAFRQALANAVQLLGLSPATRGLSVSAFHFDGAFSTAFGVLAAGGFLVVPRREDLVFVKPFFRAVLEHGVNYTSFSPTYLRLVVSTGELEKLAGSQLATLGLGGEECNPADVARLWEVLPQLRVFNRYGPTETTIAVTNYRVTGDDVASGKVPIGEPQEGTRFYIVDAEGDLVRGPGRVGELYIGGAQLMRGYWGDARLSEGVLRRDIVPGELVYKTGDLVYRDQMGRYMWAGRADDVIKRNGVRISLAEVAKALREVAGVREAVCLPVDQGDDRLEIAAFVEAEGLSAAQVLGHARELLADNMLPDRVLVVGSFPMTSAGKIDRRRLLAGSGLISWQGR